jgi:hypothetical protein
LTNIETKSASVDISLSSINLKTGSYATTGSNTFFGTQTYSGSVYIANDLIVQGSSSIQYISASSVSIGTNIVQLNTANPSVRFAGLTIIDSGSIGGSGSFLYDSVQDEFIFVHRGNGTNVTSSHFVLGPETYDSLGNETYLTTNTIPKGTGKEHLIDSCIIDDGTTTCIKNNLVGTGTISGTTIYGSTAVCSPVGKFTSCIDAGTGTFSGTLTDKATNISADGAGVVLQGYVDNVLRIAVRGSGYNDGARGGLIALTGDFSSTINGTTIYGSTVVCSPVGLFSGCVGIGLATPRSLLELSKTSGNTCIGVSSNASLTISQGGSLNELSQIGFGYTQTTSPASIVFLTTCATDYTKGSLIFATRDAVTDTAPTERMRLCSNGFANFACELTAKTLGTNDLLLNNLNYECANYVDGTRGSWLIQEGACDLFIINQVSCKKYKFNLIEIK